VIAAHCGTRSAFSEPDYFPQFARMAEQYENFFGDTSALNLPTLNYAWERLLTNNTLRKKIVHGSDWPIISLPPVRELGLASLRLLKSHNWMHRDVLIKERLGLDEAYWHRASKILRLNQSPAIALSTPT
ncbi:MAG: hypothetical protein JWN51_2212, partial [Phycisphaerales bacterium]|nr:hypothetical protein [Phycisphaerales bacterium]